MLTAVRHAIEFKVTLGPAVSRTFVYWNISVSFCDFSVHVHIAVALHDCFPKAHKYAYIFQTTQPYVGSVNFSAAKDEVVPNDCCVLCRCSIVWHQHSIQPVDSHTYCCTPENHRHFHAIVNEIRDWSHHSVSSSVQSRFVLKLLNVSCLRRHNKSTSVHLSHTPFTISIPWTFFLR